MSLRVDPSAISEQLGGRSFAYVLTVKDGRVHAVAHAVNVDGGSVTIASASESLVRRVGDDPAVTLLWPPSDDVDDEYGRYSLIADGEGAVSDGGLIVEITRATLHRPAS